MIIRVFWFSKVSLLVLAYLSINIDIWILKTKTIVWNAVFKYSSYIEKHRGRNRSQTVMQL